MSCLWMHNNDYAHDLQNVNACLTPRCYTNNKMKVGDEYNEEGRVNSLEGKWKAPHFPQTWLGGMTGLVSGWMCNIMDFNRHFFSWGGINE